MLSVASMALKGRIARAAIERILDYPCLRQKVSQSPDSGGFACTLFTF